MFHPSMQCKYPSFHLLLTTPFAPLPLRAKRLPIFPKHTQLQNSTLKIQVPPSIVSILTPPSPSPPKLPRYFAVVFLPGLGMLTEAGEGIMSGFEARRRAVPVAPTKAERRKPGLERSMRYHRTGLTRASVREAWRVDAHGNLRCVMLAKFPSPHCRRESQESRGDVQ